MVYLILPMVYIAWKSWKPLVSLDRYTRGNYRGDGCKGCKRHGRGYNAIGGGGCPAVAIGGCPIAYGLLPMAWDGCPDHGRGRDIWQGLRVAYGMPWTFPRPRTKEKPPDNSEGLAAIRL